MTNFQSIILAVLLLFLGNSTITLLNAQSEETLSFLTMDEAISLALHKNNLVKSSEYSVKKANWDVKRAWAELFPALHFNTRYTWIDKQTFAERDFRQYLPPELSSQIPQTVFQESYFSSLDLSMPLFNGALLNGLSIAYEQETMMEKMSESTRHQTILGVITSYLGVIRNKEIVNIQKEYLTLSQLNFEKAERLYKANRYSQNEALRWKIDFQQQKSSVVNSEANLRSELLTLGKFTNSKVDETTSLEVNIPVYIKNEIDKIKLISDEEILSMIDLNDEEIAKVNAALSAAKSNTEINELFHKNSYSSYMPNVNLTYSYGWRENNTIDFDDYSPKTLMVTFSMPIFTGFQNFTKLKSTLYEYKKSEEEFKNQLQETRLLVNSVANRILNLKAQLSLSESNVEFTENNYKVVERQKNRGLVSNIEYIDAKLNSQNAKLTNVSNIYDFTSSVVELYYLTGKIENLFK